MRFQFLCLTSLVYTADYVSGQRHNFEDEVMDAIESVDILTVLSPSTGLVGRIVPAISGSISAIASFLIIYLIVFRSDLGLSTTYHRVMFGLSIFDILSSLMMALTTLPMPKDMVYTQFQGLSIGNNASCQAQAAILQGATTGAFCYIAGLCIYYLCTIVFKVKRDTIRKYIEPLIHLFAIGVAVTLGTVGIIGYYYNPSPFTPYCSVSPFPYWCAGGSFTEASFGESLRPSDDASRTSFNECSIALSDTTKSFQASVNIYVFLSNLIIWSVILFCLLIVILAVWRDHRILKSNLKSLNSGTMRIRTRGARKDESDESNVEQQRENDTQMLKTSYRNTKIIFFHAISYILVCILINIFPTLNFLLAPGYNIPDAYHIFFMLIILPSQGFFNFLVFVSHKIQNIKATSQEHVTIGQCLQKIFTSREERVVLFSRISMVARNHQNEQEMELSVVDDDGNEINISYAPSTMAGNAPDNDLSENETGFVDDISSRKSFPASWFSRSTASRNQSSGVSSVGRDGSI